MDWPRSLLVLLSVAVVFGLLQAHCARKKVAAQLVYRMSPILHVLLVGLLCCFTFFALDGAAKGSERVAYCAFAAFALAFLIYSVSNRYWIDGDTLTQTNAFFTKQLLISRIKGIRRREWQYDFVIHTVDGQKMHVPFALYGVNRLMKEVVQEWRRAQQSVPSNGDP